ncbi:globin domain-containing protein [Streptomyces sp. YS415]|uniref:globin domain-containing protein n=1 Tax=Streptomyces sp. YS415 TaxID=2944806 RepID=UPI0020212A2F|nr:globin domain-containing protein [Streptomyces sp. YS415]MCL7423572.1 FAD-binding oxidoreductase [Streptomyces sp. YS415]
MLSEKSAATVRATLPAVGASLDEITERFYAGLFAARPDLLRDLFNRGNQAAGTQRRALAGSVAAFATYLVEHPDHRPDAMLARIAHKHASLGVAPEQYGLVHEHMFAAIADVLGEAVTPEVAAAWDEVYWLMANALIALEKRLYEESREPGRRQWEVVERVQETPDVITLRLRPLDGGPVADFRAGQYVSVRVELPDGARQIRQYSLSGAPGSTLRQISVKREAGGEVSAHLHARVQAGSVLELSAPYGDLTLDEGPEVPLLLASAGIGVTPMIAMLAQLAQDGHACPVTVVHGDRSPATHALRADQESYAAKLPDASVHFWYEEDAPEGARAGRVDLTGIAVAPGTRAYLCGPLPFMRAVRAQLLGKGVAAADIHYEVFGPDLWLTREG